MHCLGQRGYRLPLVSDGVVPAKRRKRQTLCNAGHSPGKQHLGEIQRLLSAFSIAGTGNPGLAPNWFYRPPFELQWGLFAAWLTSV